MSSVLLERLFDRAFGRACDAKREAEPKSGVMDGERCRTVPATA